MRALSIRQPYAELILRGEKAIEYRSRPTKIIGQRFLIYAARKWAGVLAKNTPSDGIKEGDCPTGVIVGSAVISKVTPPTKEMPYYHWHLSKVKRIKKPRKPKRQPQPVWFTPY